MAWRLYVIRTTDRKLYAGVTTDVARRFREHLSQGRRTARYLRAHKPQRMEVDEYIERSRGPSAAAGRQAVVSNGSHPQRELVTGIGKLSLRQPRVHDRREGHHFTGPVAQSGQEFWVSASVWVR